MPFGAILQALWSLWSLMSTVLNHFHSSEIHLLYSTEERESHMGLERHYGE